MAADPFTAILETGNNIIDKIWPDADEADRRKLELAKIAQTKDLAKLQAHVQSLTGQLQINKQEAAHKSIFVAGWRPFVGWVCGVALAYNFILQPLFNWALFAFGADISNAPELDITDLIAVLGGMLGFGYYRTREKESGVASDSMRINK